ncbi:hypothetical protein [Pseudochrobactrum sp. HB0163]|uniref:hypothetical protein n=1 Tax=Pseudochrobactrum sp. HB0163 TaxID=3450708 RepID=UPI003F6E37ED
MSRVVNSLWIGKRLGAVHAACLRSFLRHGHEVVLHSYGTPEDTPKGVKVFDAAKLMKESEIVQTRSGNLALASDIYRYRILREGLGLYADCDVYCIKPVEDSDYIMGWEAHNTINGAVLKVPHNSAMLQQLQAAAEDPYFIPPWFSRSRRMRYQLRKAFWWPKPVSRQAWGVIGSGLITYVAKELGLGHLASPIDYYYPMHYTCASLLSEKGLSVKELITPRTVAFHLYNSATDKQEILPDTPLYEIINS